MHSWDEWVPSHRLLKHNDTNIAIQKTLQSQANATNAAVNASNRAAKSGPSGSHREHHSVGGLGSGSTRVRKDGARGTKRGREEVRLRLFPLSLLEYVDISGRAITTLGRCFQKAGD